MTYERVMFQLRDILEDKKKYMDKEDPEDVISEDVKALEQAIKMLRDAEKVKQLEKEIEELNKNKQQIVYEEIYTPDYVEENFISKDKIREKVKKLENRKWSYTKLEDIRRVDDEINVLRGLLCDNCEFGAEDYDNCIGCENDE